MVSCCRALYDIGPAVTIFGSVRLGEGHPYYVLAREFGKHLAEAGYAVMTEVVLVLWNLPIGELRSPEDSVLAVILSNLMSKPQIPISIAP